MLKKGQTVKIISSGKIAAVIDVRSVQQETRYKMLVDGQVKWIHENLVEQYVDLENQIIDSGSFFIDSSLRDFEQFKTWLKLHKPFNGQIYSYLGSKTIFNPFQFKPLLKFLAPYSMERLLIADEVGVGKTIESGIIMTELMARQKLSYNAPILIVCPSILMQKWQYEMSERFQLEFTIHNRHSFLQFIKGVYQNATKRNDMIGIVSFQTIRSEEFIELFEKLEVDFLEPIWSLVIIDEAHHMRNSGTNSNRIGEKLSILTERLIMLTATPLNLKNEDLFQLMKILNPLEFDDFASFEGLLPIVSLTNKLRKQLTAKEIEFDEALKTITELKNHFQGTIDNHEGIRKLEMALLNKQPLSTEQIVRYERLIATLNPLDTSFTRTLKREAIKDTVIRDVQKLPVYLSDTEKALYEEVHELATELYLTLGGDARAIGFISNMPKRMAASCLPGVKRYVESVLQKKMFEIEQPLEDLEDELEQLQDSGQLKQLPLTIQLEKRLQQLSNSLQHLTEDTKFTLLSQYIEKLFSTIDNKRIIIFSFFIQTVHYLQQQFENLGYKTAIITGQTPLYTSKQALGRYDIIERFKKGEIEILIASDVGGEGLDFQFCQALINYDLPYNPMKIEQRIGRIDRFGQKANKIYIANMYLADTVDERIYELLYERLDIIHQHIGTFEPIVGQQLYDLQQQLSFGTLSEQEAIDRLHLIELAIEKEKVEKEQFDQQRHHFLGDEELSSMIIGISSNDRLIQPINALNFTKYFLQLEQVPYRSKPNKSIEFKLTEKLREQMQQFMKLPTMVGATNEFHALLKQDKIQLQFNIETLFENEIFVPPTGYWTRFVKQQLDQADNMYKLFSIKIQNTAPIEPGTYICFIHQIEWLDLNEHYELKAVLYNLSTEEITLQDDTILFERQITGSGEEFYEIEDIHAIMMTCNDFLDDKLQHLQNERNIELRSIQFTRENAYKEREKQKTAMLQNRLKQQSLNPVYKRLIEGQIASELKRTELKIAKLYERMSIAYTSELVGVLLIQAGE
ncbi:SNF2-related protein [Psychrobacillus sp. BL-248-WT-3]|uniref:DEAD/DEAH box helicase n=1 Tax=Psychrobacillus sp. BL-248-WT-3 TaxID=2725306 RepID=UPI00146ABC65|nr:SNF2-related protein [Psychrobacillus sp. BL-248-WT-3]NME06227.1 DEAD/DEAH box helicase [Psychrobacillus sp. BL-248-WT-3]